jgi:hypothetical protein
MTAPTARGHPVGVRSVVFADRDLDALVDELETTDVRHLELWGEHLSPADDEATVAAAVDRLDAAGIGVCGYGVVDLNRPGEAREHVAFADRSAPTT